MFISLTELDRTKRSFSFEGEVVIPDSVFAGASYEFTDAYVSGTAAIDEKTVDLQATVTGTYKTVCDRCASDVEVSYKTKFTQRFSQERADVDANDEVLFIEGTRIELDPVVQAAVFASLPMQTLCKPDCRGLCPQCGTNLNDGECGCTDDYTDPRFDILKNFKAEQ